MRRIIAAAVLAVAGALMAMFLVFVPLFSDGPADKFDPEYLVSYALIFAGYVVVSYVGARWGGWRWWTAAWLTPLAALLLAGYQEPPVVQRLVIALDVAVAAGAGMWLALRAERPAGAPRDAA